MAVSARRKKQIKFEADLKQFLESNQFCNCKNLKWATEHSNDDTTQLHGTDANENINVMVLYED